MLKFVQMVLGVVGMRWLAQESLLDGVSSTKSFSDLILKGKDELQPMTLG